MSQELSWKNNNPDGKQIMAITGNIEHISNYRIAGWAKNTENDIPVLVNIYVNDFLLKTVRADIYRKDLEKIQENGICGFELRIDNSLLSLLPIKSAIKIVIDETSLPYGAGVQKTIQGSCATGTSLKGKLLDGYIVNKNGVLIYPIDKRGGAWIEKALDDYQLVKEIFKQEFGYDLCIAYGTLLGFIRENGPIGHDDDLDATYISRHEDPKEIVKERNEIIKVFEKQGHYARPIANGQIHVVVNDGVLVDVFTSWFSEDFFHLYFAVRSSAINKDDVFPLQETDFLSRRIYIPKKPEKMLKAIYGEGWAVPDPHFQWRVDAKTKAYFKEFEAL